MSTINTNITTSTAKKVKTVKPINPIKVKEQALKQAYLVCFYAAMDDIEGGSQIIFEHRWCEHYANISAASANRIKGLKQLTNPTPEMLQYFRLMFDRLIVEFRTSKGSTYDEHVESTEDGSISRMARLCAKIIAQDSALDNAVDYRNELLTHVIDQVDGRDRAMYVVTAILALLKSCAKGAATMIWQGEFSKDKIPVNTAMFMMWLSIFADPLMQDTLTDFRKALPPKPAKKVITAATVMSEAINPINPINPISLEAELAQIDNVGQKEQTIRVAGASGLVFNVVSGGASGAAKAAVVPATSAETPVISTTPNVNTAVTPAVPVKEAIIDEQVSVNAN